jgi:hypothetical protein
MLSPKQEQCKANLRSLMDRYSLPGIQLDKAEEDRCRYHYSQAFLDSFEKLVKKGDFKKHWWERGYRENVGEYAAEFEFNKKKKLLKADIDINNPWWDMEHSFKHLAEVLGNIFGRKKTDPFAVMAGLRERGIEVEDVRNAVSQNGQ